MDKLPCVNRRRLLEGALLGSLGIVGLAACQPPNVVTENVPSAGESNYFGQLPAHIRNFPKLPETIEIAETGQLRATMLLQKELDRRVQAISAERMYGRNEGGSSAMFRVIAGTGVGEETYYAKTYTFAEGGTYTREYFDMEVRLNKIYRQAIYGNGPEALAQIESEVFTLQQGERTYLMVKDVGDILPIQATKAFKSEQAVSPYAGAIAVNWDQYDFASKEGLAEMKGVHEKLAQDFAQIINEAKVQMQKFYIQYRQIPELTDFEYSDWGAFNNIAAKEVDASMAGKPGVIKLNNSGKFVQVRWIDFDPYAFTPTGKGMNIERYERISKRLTWDKYLDNAAKGIISKGSPQVMPTVITRALSDTDSLPEAVKPQAEGLKSKIINAMKGTPGRISTLTKAAGESLFTLFATYEAYRLANPVILGGPHQLTRGEPITDAFPDRRDFFDSKTAHALDQFGYEPLDRLIYNIDLNMLALKYAPQAATLMAPYLGSNSAGMSNETREKMMRMSLEELPPVAVTILGQNGEVPVPMDLQMKLNASLKPTELIMNIYALPAENNRAQLPQIESFTFSMDDKGRMTVIEGDPERINGGIRTLMPLYSHGNEEKVREYLLSLGAKPEEVDAYLAPQPVVIRPSKDMKDFVIYFENINPPPISALNNRPMRRRQALGEIFRWTRSQV